MIIKLVRYFKSVTSAFDMRCALVLVAAVLVVSTKGTRVHDEKMFTSVKRVSTKCNARLLAISLQVLMIFY